MKFFPNVFGPPTLRGRISRTSIVRGGEISVTVRFGIEEREHAKKLVPGLLLEVIEVPEKKPKKEPTP